MRLVSDSTVLIGILLLPAHSPLREGSSCLGHNHKGRTGGSRMEGIHENKLHSIGIPQDANSPRTRDHRSLRSPSSADSGDGTTYCLDRSSRSEGREATAHLPRDRPHLDCSVLRGTET
jgi:hypothetical protein